MSVSRSNPRLPIRLAPLGLILALQAAAAEPTLPPAAASGNAVTSAGAAASTAGGPAGAPTASLSSDPGTAPVGMWRSKGHALLAPATPPGGNPAGTSVNAPAGH